MKSKNDLVDWASLMNQYESSGLKQRQFCETNGVDLAKFRYQRARFCGAKKLKSEHPSNAGFIPVKLPEYSSSNEKITIIHPNGIECSVPSSIKVSTLVQLLQGIKGC